MPETAGQVYEKRKKIFSQRLADARQKGDRLALLRLLAFLLAAALAGFGFYSGRREFVLYALSPAVAFLLLVIHHLRLKETITYLENMVDINTNSLRRLAWQWDTFSEKGEVHAHPHHPYSIDLNIFGRGSLFQYINSTVTYGGEQALASRLQGQEKPRAIKESQEAVKELVGSLHWRQHFQAKGMGEGKRKENPVRLLAWGKDPGAGAVYLDALLLIPVLTALLFLLYFLQVISLALPLALLAVQAITVLLTEKMVSRSFARTEMASDILKQYAGLLACIEGAGFTSSRLKHLQKTLSQGPHPASRQIKGLAGIVERIKFRHYQPIIYFPVNVATFWDLYTVKKLRTWKRSSGTVLEKWLEVLGEFEVYTSLAGIGFENPDWVYPEITYGEPSFHASCLGHPLIKPEIRVCNDVSLPVPGTALIITGSNMSGKSTFLRTVGINLVLAYAGAPVCATELKTAFLPVFSKMQVVDDLAQGVSTYYAELSRIKMVIEAAKEGKPILYLLDEIFRGTNSRDRILGTKAIIRMLSRLPTLGLVTTHDLELAVLAEANPRLIKNYHFEDQMADSQITFDYRLKPGVSTTTNAVALMKMVGIAVEEDSI